METPCQLETPGQLGTTGDLKTRLFIPYGFFLEILNFWSRLQLPEWRHIYLTTRKKGILYLHTVWRHFSLVDLEKQRTKSRPSRRELIWVVWHSQKVCNLTSSRDFVVTASCEEAFCSLIPTFCKYQHAKIVAAKYQKKVRLAAR